MHREDGGSVYPGCLKTYQCTVPLTREINLPGRNKWDRLAVIDDL